MKALYMRGHGELEQIEYGDLPEPAPNAGEVVVDVKAAALNRLDLFVLRGIPGIDLAMPHVGGADGAGVVAAVGDGVSGWSVGDEVVLNPGVWCGACEFCRRGDESLCVRFGLLGEHRPGTFAERVRVPAASLGRKPSHLTWVEAAAFPLVYLTAWRMLVTRARLEAGETVLIHGIGGGVALAALAIAKRLGARAIVTSGSAEKLRRARELGADEAIDYTAADVAKQVRGLTGRRGVDVVVESTGAATWMASLRSACKGGRIVTCGATTGPQPAEEIRLIFWNQLSILGSTMGSVADWRSMIDAVERWGLRPAIDSAHRLADGRAAYERLERRDQFGKIVLAVSSDVAVTLEHDHD
jgi:NADPH:quinone reductase-like Zn-dependent oxidoreductase